MWYLQCLNDTYVYLYDKDNYTIGRKNKDITIENDESISRNHATLKLKEKNLYLIDTSSKYGTFIGEEKLNPNEEYKLSNSDLITFGLLNNNQSKFKVKNVNLKLIFSNMSSENKNSQLEIINTLNLERVKAWDKSCTHIIASEAKLTSKMLCAVVTGQHIVNTNFFPDLLEAIKNKKQLPKESDYKPVFKEILLNKNMNLDYNPERRNLFKDLIFVFATTTSMNKFSDVIRLIGGIVMHCSKDNQYLLTELQANSHRYIIINDCDDKDIPQSYKDATNFFHSTGKRTIPSHEIPLAIVLNSKEENCNPSFNRINLLIREGSQKKLPEDIWAFDTQHSTNQKSQNQNTPSTDDQDIPSLVEPTISTDTSVIRDTPGVKRTLEVDITSVENNPRKKVKEDQFNTFLSCKKTKSNIRNTQSNLDKFIFDKKVSKETKVSESIQSPENPFSRKRKAANDLKPEPKKRPLENISNLVTKVKEKANTKDTSSAVKLSTSWIKKEFTENEIKQKNYDPQDTEIEKLNDKFKDSIIITFCPLVPRKQNISGQIENSRSMNNFKKFKKVYQSVQHEIIYNVSKVIIGDESKCPSDNEENKDDDDDDDMEFIGSFQSNTTICKAPKPRRRFQFS